MEFRETNDGVLYLYPYYSLTEKNDQKSKEVYQVFKKNWDTYFNGICEDLFDAVDGYFDAETRDWCTIAVAVMPSHLKGTYGEKLLAMAEELTWEFGFEDASYLIQRTKDKVKSTEGGLRDVGAHLETMKLAGPVDEDVDIYIILDDITTSGSSLEAAKRLLIGGGVNAGCVVKMAIAKTMHDDGHLA